MTTATPHRYVETLKKTVETKSTREGHQLGPWGPGPFGALAVARCARCDRAVEIREAMGGRRHEYRALTEACRGESDAVIREREYRAQYEWAWLRAGDALPGGHVLGCDLEVRIHWSKGLPWTNPPTPPTAYACIDDQLKGRMYADGSGGAQGKGPTVEAALADLKAQLVRHLADFEREVADAQRVRDRFAQVVQPTEARS